jgi:hypothetical protein
LHVDSRPMVLVSIAVNADFLMAMISQTFAGTEILVREPLVEGWSMFGWNESCLQQIQQ